MIRAVVHKSIPRKRSRGAPIGNGNARKRIIIPNRLRLDDVESILKFMREMLIPFTLSGKIGTRQSSAITTACRTLLDYDNDLRHIQEIEENLARIEVEMKKWDEDAKLKQRRAVTNPVGGTNEVP
ncbi:MAG: hypothetical protein ABSF63_03520 [Candidatus Bathyarchaeia archaeon]|jgi:hypothetical protein